MFDPFPAVSTQVKVKGKPSNDRPPYFDFSVLRLKSLRMILLSSGIGAIGAYTPLFYLVIKPKCVFIILHVHVLLEIRAERNFDAGHSPARQHRHLQ